MISRFVGGNLKFKLPKLGNHTEYLRSIFPTEIVNNAKFETAFFKEKGTTVDDRFNEAERLLKFEDEANLDQINRLTSFLNTQGDKNTT